MSSAAAPALNGLRVFISYPRGGGAHSWAERLHIDLHARGATVWRDEGSIEPGSADWLARIEDGLQRAHVVACVIGRESAGSVWQQREMLRADQLSLPLLVCRVADVGLPLYVIERQPFELRDEAAFGPLAVALAALRPARLSGSAAAPAAPNAARRQRERAYLEALLHGELSTHEARYVPLAGEQRRAPTLERSHKGLRSGLRIDATSVLEAFRRHGHRHDAPHAGVPSEAAPVPYADVLDAYRALPAAPIRRLAVLGEPGAGKSFSLERIAVDHARQALHDAAAPIPVLVRLGLWTRTGESLPALVERQLGELGADFDALLAERRAVLLLDGLNEIPPGQRRTKAMELRALAEDERLAAVLASCRVRDFQEEFDLPFDRLTLQPLTPLQVHRFLHRAYRLDRGEEEGERVAEQRFWAIAGGERLQDAWQAWQRAGASFELFMSAEDIPRKDPDVYSKTSASQDEAWRSMRRDPRSLLHLAANPYVLTVMALLPELPRNRAELFGGFLRVLHAREKQAREDRHDAASVPAEDAWLAALSALAEALQRTAPSKPSDDDPDDEAAGREPGAGTSLPRDAWPASMTPPLLAFSRDASVLQLSGDDLRFTHQLLQEALASRVLLHAARTGNQPAATIWPAASWWQRTGWEVVADIAAESVAGDTPTLMRFLGWLVEAQPEAASLAWQRAGATALPPTLAAAITQRWLPRLADERLEQQPIARAAIGRALAAFDLDHRPGVGLRRDGLPDIAWVRIADGKPFIYQGKRHRALSAFEIARYPVTNRQFQAFVGAGGYRDGRWWQGLTERFDEPLEPQWSDANAPRETVSWYEAMAFCRWLGHALGCEVNLPTEQQWERAAAGPDGRVYPWGAGFDARRANSYEGPSPVGRTTAVGLYPYPSAEGVFDLAGNVWEWCLNEYDKPAQIHPEGEASRVLRGGSWDDDAEGLRAADRDDNLPDGRGSDIGFRVCRWSPIEKLPAGALNAEPPKR